MSGNSSTPIQASMGIGGDLAISALPHHLAYGSVPRRFGWSGNSLRGCRAFVPGARMVRSSLSECPWASPRGKFDKDSLRCFSRRYRPMTPPTYLPLLIYPVRSSDWAPFGPSRHEPSALHTGILHPAAGFLPLLRPLLTSALRWGRLSTSSVPNSRQQRRSPGVSSIAFTAHSPDVQTQRLDGYGLRVQQHARPRRPASYPISVRRVAVLHHASFRPSLARCALARC